MMDEGSCEPVVGCVAKKSSKEIPYVGMIKIPLK
jgi:hypothetical protein